MMMAHDSGPGPRQLDAEILNAVQLALVEYAGAPSDGEALRRALQELAADARARAVLPETLLVTLKDIWYSLPVARGPKDPAEQTRILQRVVTMCIKEYYAA